MSSQQNKILIIEDDKDMVEALKIILEGKFYQVEAAFNGKQGLEKIEEDQPDLVILDLLLPGENGAIICHTLKHSPKYQNIPILVLTALARKVEEKVFSHPEEELLAADEYLDKPIEPQDLIHKVEKLLENRREPDL